MIGELAEMMRSRRTVALTGAGCSTESGIPDYRGEGARPRNPIRGPDFRSSASVRQRYWSRSMLGWPRLRAAAPNEGHRAFAVLEQLGVLSGVVTQNVDRLHHEAGSRQVVELHGALAEVRCLTCGVLHARDDVQRWLLEANETLAFDTTVEIAPDGDAELDAQRETSFRVVDCPGCGGVLQPNVVFFGDNVARPVVERAFAMVESAQLLLVAGTSLAVYSGYRFLRRAVELEIPVAIVNFGPVRGEEHAAIRIAAATGRVLPDVADRLRLSPFPRPPAEAGEAAEAAAAPRTSG